MANTPTFSAFLPAAIALLLLLATAVSAGRGFDSVITVADSSSCPAGTTACTPCPNFNTQCCKSGESCYQLYGCLSTGYAACQGQDSCTVQSVSCPCPGGAASCASAQACCGGGCCQGSPVFGDPVPTPSHSPAAATTAPSLASSTVQSSSSSAAATTSAPSSSSSTAATSSSAITTTKSTAKLNVSSTTKASSSSSCVDAAWLDHALAGEPNQLVHLRPIHANVLCPVDSDLPCATPRHIVAVDGTHITYQQLCALVECDRAAMPVNAAYTHKWNTIHMSRVGHFALPNGKAVALTMYSDVCHYRLQIVAHRILEAVHTLYKAVLSKATTSS